MEGDGGMKLNEGHGMGRQVVLERQNTMKGNNLRRMVWFSGL